MIGDRAQEQRAELGALSILMFRSPKDVVIEADQRIVHRAIEVFEELDDEEGLGSAHAHLALDAWMTGRATEQLSEAEVALVYTLRSEASSAGAIVNLAAALLVGPTPAGAALHRCERLAGQVIGDRSAEAEVNSDLAWFLGLVGRSDDARAAGWEALAVFEDLGDRWSAAEAVLGLSCIEWWAGDPPAAEEGIRAFYEMFREMGNKASLPLAAAFLAELLLDLGRDDEVLELTDEIRGIAAPYDVEIQVRWRAARSVALARLGFIDEAIPMVEESERLARTTEFLVALAGSILSKAEVLKLADRREDAVSAAREALALYEAKEWVPHIGWARSMLDSLSV